MRIRKFYEAEDIKISTERVSEIIEELSKTLTEIDNKSKNINSISIELNNYKSKSKKSNNQIDDASININLVKSKLDEATTSIDSIIKILKDYNENGSKFLY
jgi:chromosome segregation ATPase